MLKNPIPAIPSAPAKLTNTKDTAAIKKVLTSLALTLTNPTIIPITTNNPSMTVFKLASDAPKIPTARAKTTPIKKAHAPNKFSLDFIAILFFLPSIKSKILYKSSVQGKIRTIHIITKLPKHLNSAVILELQHKMKAKIFTSVLLTIFMTGLVLAAAISLSPSTLTFKAKDQTLTFDITNTGADDVDITLPSAQTITSNGNTATFTFSTTDTTTSVSNGDVVKVNVKMSGDPTLFDFGTYSTSATVTAANTADSSITNDQTITTRFTSGFCKAGEAGGNLTIETVNVDNEDGDDDEWELLDVIEIEVDVENNGDDEVEDVIIELGLFDSSGKNVADDLEWDSVDEEEADVGDIDDDDEETAVFRFRVPADLDDGNYKLTIKAYGDDVGESNECTDTSDDFSNEFYEAISVDRESDEERFIVVDDILLDEQVSCGDTVAGSFTVFNIGDEDQERVQITMVSEDLKVNREFEITSDLDEGDDEEIDFSFVVPSGLNDGSYPLDFRTFYDYKKGVYRERSEDKFTAFVNVIGCSTSSGSAGQGSAAGNAIITASLASDAKAGEELIINSIITNIGPGTFTFVVDASGYQDWAELKSISERILNLNSGDSKTLSLVFDVDDEASGSQTFVIEATSAGVTQTREVEVNIASADAKTSTGITGFAGLEGLGGGSNLIWVIGIINIVLLVLIILVAVRLSRR
jgi:hypothetical protein